MRQYNIIGKTYTDDVLRASLCSKHAQNTSSTSNIKDGLALEQMWIVHDGGAIGPRPDGVLEHLFVDACLQRGDAAYQ